MGTMLLNLMMAPAYSFIFESSPDPTPWLIRMDAPVARVREKVMVAQMGVMTLPRALM